ncbi:hypothetical protein [Phaeobacter italicus]|uniref:hypothetical protein n=1 Tax=Phaeobacter italicus TaxID=481446 RepID=UPI001CD1E5B0|nr:hypothetical protein [Phaeobacter italicus]MCA0858829.1 hypothetical protein [Phaeobacter italicus]
MTDYTIEIGEHGILGVAAHLSVRFTDSDGNRIVEINGLATSPNGNISATGAAITGHDIRGYIWGPDGPSFFGLSRTRSVDTLGTRPSSSLEDDLRIIQAIVEEINDRNIPYQALNTNSNSVAMTVLRGLGYTVEDVRAISTRLTPGINIELLTEEEIQDIIGDAGSAGTGTDQCFKSDTPIQMWPLDPSIKPRSDGTYDEQQILSGVWEKQIEEISAGDVVLSYDKDGNLKPGHVVRTFRNEVTHILDFWGTGVTPGHAYLCADGVFKDQHVPLMDILRTDGAIMRDDGTLIRAATNCEVGSAEDQFVLAVVGTKQPNGRVKVSEARKIRVGTRVILQDGQDTSLLELITASGGTVTEDGLVQIIDGHKLPFRWELSDHLPAPEDYILQRSDVTLDAIYAASEWESIGTNLPAPLAAVEAPVANVASGSRPAPNIPPAFANHPDAPVQRFAKAATPSLN